MHLYQMHKFSLVPEMYYGRWCNHTILLMGRVIAWLEHQPQTLFVASPVPSSSPNGQNQQ